MNVMLPRAVKQMAIAFQPSKVIRVEAGIKEMMRKTQTFRRPILICVNYTCENASPCKTSKHSTAEQYACKGTTHQL
jgi:hypothetical protein